MAINLDFTKPEDQRELSKWAAGQSAYYLQLDQTKDIFPGYFPLETMDYRVVDAIITVESQWDPEAVSPDGAIGLGQILPTGKEFGSFNTAREKANEEPFSPDDLTNPYINATITSFGLGMNLAAQNPEPSDRNIDWSRAAIGYFGCTSYDQPGDLYTSCAGYAAKFEQTVREKYGDAAWRDIQNGVLPPVSDRVPERLLSESIPGPGTVVRRVAGTVEGILADIQNTLTTIGDYAANGMVLLISAVIAGGIITGAYMVAKRQSPVQSAITSVIRGEA